MSLPARFLNMSVAEYLRAEETNDVKHEFVDGQVYAMTGASEAHNVIAANMLTLLREHVRGSGCRAFMADMKLRVEANNSFYYPDVMVTCEAYDSKSLYKESPVLICEVLSPSTMEIDRREKLAAYKQLPDLREYLVIHQDQRRVEVYRKDINGHWQLHIVQTGDIELSSMPNGALSVPVESIYEDTAF